ncbi:hypothetical protein EG68_07663 [Paragonimus skrjabini miyazakii]|uniref:Uncharacterized protein n=1 Tax=Paragonimus skrjabini miyazakii TaxID=59628 RepID=A0A8S9YQU3_9TREM|nr:hypothetical protein EG68_07663 [Paragonimus skrjabini miyazakii]
MFDFICSSVCSPVYPMPTQSRLAATLAELKQCQVNIGQLRAQMDKVDKTRTDKTQSQSQRGKYTYLFG